MAEPDRRARLEAVRERLDAAIRGCESMRDLPSLVREYRAVMVEIESLPDREGVSPADEVARRRADRRRSGSPGSSRPARSG